MYISAERSCKEGTSEHAVFLDSRYKTYCCGLKLGSKVVNCNELSEQEIGGIRLPVCLKACRTIENKVT